jgi:phenylacetate-CoA ligase
VSESIKNHILVTAKIEILPPGTLPRSFAKTKRVIDERDKD